MFQRKPKVREKYISLERAAEVLSLVDSQLKQYLVTGQLLAAIIHHKPSGYRESEKIMLGDGTTAAVRTKTSMTALQIVSDNYKSNPLMYLRPEDTSKIILNKTNDREMLVFNLFPDRSLESKTQTIIGSGISVRSDDLIITADELYRFAKDAKINIKRKARSEIDIPLDPWYTQILRGVIILVLANIILMLLRGEAIKIPLFFSGS